ncbi:MAG: outer membrane protein assembly factor BamE [Gammaproteobacteria bacterium]|nr:outer membrane protein assembly factor BamE [Gammaproteobacteria bacterium]
MRFILIATITIFVTGCSLFKPYKMDIPQGNLITREMLDEVTIGMTKEQARFILGTPITSTPLADNLWLYYFQTTDNGMITQRQSIKLQFDNDNLISIEGTPVITNIIP